MKKLINLILVVLLASFNNFSQIPERINYQAVIRNSTGELVTSQDVGLKVSILNETSTGTVLYSEEHAVTTNAFGQVAIEIGDGTNASSDFSAIDWGVSDKFLRLEVDIEGGTSYIPIGTSQILSVPYAFYANDADLAKVAEMAYSTDIAGFAEIADSARVAGMAYTADVLGSSGVYTTSTDTLFVVKDQQGNVVFTVFPDGAEVIVNETAKGKVGGFAVSGRSPSKAVDVDILKVTVDSTRIYVNDTVNIKGKVGGFAVSGRSPSKTVGNELFFVTADSTRVYVNDDPLAKGKVGGFAVSGRSPSKGTSQHMFVTTIDSTRIFTQDTIRGFGVRDNSSGKSTSYLQLTPLNYFIGHRAGESITSGKYNTFIGYETGLNSTWGNGNMFLGFNAGRGNVDGALNVFIGRDAGLNFTGVEDGEENIFIGNAAGHSCTTTANSIFIGTRSGYYCGASYGNTFIGDRTASFGIAGDNNTILGSAAGFRVSGSENVFIGAYAGNATTNGNLNTYIGYQAGISSIGKRNVFIGANAGAGETGSNKLYIANSADSSLITGDFVAQEVFIDGDLTATTVLPSDINLKTNFIEIKSGLKLLSTLTAYYFNWNDLAKKEFNYSTDEQQIGIIAQDVEKVFPQMVVTNSKGYKAVEYSKLSPIIIEAVKEQQQQINKQHNKIDQLEKENQELIERLKKLEELILK